MCSHGKLTHCDLVLTSGAGSLSSSGALFGLLLRSLLALMDWLSGGKY